MPSLFDSLVAELRMAARDVVFRRRNIELFLGSDREIGRESRSIERRVGIVPSQIRQLVELFASLGLELRVMVLRGAGERAGFSDADYLAAGAEIVTENQLDHLDGPPDVVHALKEPSRYEALLPGPFCRIGALHTGDFETDSGLGRLLETDGFAIFDGSNVGAPGAFRIPIRGSMSIFAGEIAAEWVLDHAARRELAGEVVVVGAGNAGKAATKKLLAGSGGPVSAVRLFDSAAEPARLGAVRRDLADPRVMVQGLGDRDDPALLDALDGAVGLILAVARPGQRAPRVLHLESLRRLAEHALVVDISIDERGAIHDPTSRVAWAARELIPHLTDRIQQLGRDYRALPNMPRSYPGKASTAHGAVVLPYVAALLYRAAQWGGPREVVDHLTCLPRQDGPDPSKVEPGAVLAALEQDLRNGLAVWTRKTTAPRPRVIVEDAVADKFEIAAHLTGRKREVEFHLGAVRGDKVRRNVLRDFDEPVAECLEHALANGIDAQVVCHPTIDGTDSAKAALALQVPARNVLKCLIVTRHPEGEASHSADDFTAVVVEGTRRVDFKRLAGLAGPGPWRLAGADEVADLTGHTLGGVPVIEVFEKVPRVFVDRGVLALERVWGSAGSEYAGMGFPPKVLLDLGAIPGELCRPESRVRHEAEKITKAIHALEKAVDHDDDEAAAHAVSRLVRLVGPPT